MRVPSAATLSDDSIFTETEFLSWKKNHLKFIADNFKLERAADTKEALLPVVRSALLRRGKLEAVSLPASSPAVPPATTTGDAVHPPVPLSADVMRQIVEAGVAAQMQAVHESLKSMEVCMHAQFQALQQDFKLQKQQFQELQAQNSTLKDTCAALTAECSELRAGHDKLSAIVHGLQARTLSLQNDSERAERQHRGLNVILTGLPECENETPALLEGQVHDVMAALKVPVGVKVQSFSRLGQKGRTYAEAAGGLSQGRPKIRPVVLRFACTQDKIAVLKGRVNLNTSDKFRRLGVNPDLTRSQQEKKTAAWPAFIKARQEGKKTWWVDDVLFVNGTRVVPVIVTA
jgi:hypothetical protein